MAKVWVMEQRPRHRWKKDEEVKSTGLGNCGWWKLSGQFDPWVSDGATGWMMGSFIEKKEHRVGLEKRMRSLDSVILNFW